MTSSSFNSEQPAYPDFIELGTGGFALYSPAKINLGLRIIGRRPDGFHDIETLFQEVSLSDRIDFFPAEGFEIESNQPDLDLGEGNLITRAARLLAERADVPCHVRIKLWKNIPIGGGLGGGSSNAAITLMGLNRLWGLNLETDHLIELASQLGSDCAFFIYGGLVHATGRGEILDPMPECFSDWLVLVVPDFGVSTPWAYSAGKFPLTDESKSVIFQFRLKDKLHFSELSSNIFNDLENIVLSRYSKLGEVKQKLLDFGAEGSLLSGSGSVVYGIFTDFARAWNAAQQFGRPFHTIICRAVSRRRRS